MIEELLGMISRLLWANRKPLLNTASQSEASATQRLTNDVPWSLQGVTQPEPRGK